MIPIKVPPLGESVVEATIGKWLKKEGDAVQTGDTLVELETDKINVEVPAQKAGVLTKRLKNEGDVVKVDETLGEIDETASAGAGSSATKPEAASAQAAAASPAPTPSTAPAAKPPAAPEARQPDASASTAPSPAGTTAPDQAAGVKAAPSATRMAAEENLDLSKVQGTGRGGVVSKSDVIEQRDAATPTAGSPPEQAASRKPQQAASATPSATSAPAPSTQSAARSPQSTGARETREKMTTRRKRIAEHLLEAKNATASLTTFNEVDMTALDQLRNKFKERTEKEHGVKLTYMPFFVRAACMALKHYPVANATIDGESIVYRHYVNMGIAVASEQGLVVPNVKDADTKGLLDISRDIASIAKRARDNKLTMDDLTGGTFTITNGGVFGSLVSTPILNYPQVAILGLHKIQDRPVAIDGKVEIRPMMYLALTYDHRIIDGQQAVLFLVKLKELIEEPGAMLIE